MKLVLALTELDVTCTACGCELVIVSLLRFRKWSYDALDNILDQLSPSVLLNVIHLCSVSVSRRISDKLRSKCL